MRELVFSQDFNWHDGLGSGNYHFGDQGYLVMDGTTGRIQCSRLIAPPLTSPEAVVEIRLRVVLGRSYALLLYDRHDQVVVRCEFDDEGWIRFRNKDRTITTKLFLKYLYGVPAVDPEFRPTKRPFDSDEHVIRFDQFDASNGSIRFWLDDTPLLLEDAFEHPSADICKLELQTLEVEPGAVIRVRSYARRAADQVVDEENFKWDWRPVPPPPDGYPYDHVSETRVRPTGNRWLQTITQYGWLKVWFPNIARGEIEFELMTPDIQRESVILLEEYDGTFDQGQRLHAGILRERFIATGASQRHSNMFNRSFPQDAHIYFDDPHPQPNHVHAFRVTWDEGGYRMWVDDTPMTPQDGNIIPFQFAHRPFKQMNVLTLHPGMHGVRLPLHERLAGHIPPAQIPDPHVAYWGRFRIYDLTDD